MRTAVMEDGPHFFVPRGRVDQAYGDDQRQGVPEVVVEPADGEQAIDHAGPPSFFASGAGSFFGLRLVLFLFVFLFVLLAVLADDRAVRGVEHGQDVQQAGDHREDRAQLPVAVEFLVETMQIGIPVVAARQPAGP